MQLILHTPFGARINRAWGLALRKRFCRSFNFELQAAATDNGIVLSLTEQHAFPLDVVFEFVKSASVEQTLTQALLPAPMFAARWRWNATRALAILRFRGGRKVPPQLHAHARRRSARGGLPRSGGLRRESDRADSHSRSRAGARDDRQLSARGDGSRRASSRFCARSKRGAMRTVAIDTPEPSVVLPRDPQRQSVRVPRRRAARRAARARRAVAPHDARRRRRRRHARSAAIIARSREESWPVVRDADELHDALSTLIVVPPVPAVAGLVRRARRAAACDDARRRRFWTCAERLELRLRADATTRRRDRDNAPERGRHRDSARVARVERSDDGRADGGSVCSSIARRSRRRCLRLETQGQVLRGRFRSRRRRRVVQPPRARAHPSPYASDACGARSSRSPPRSTCAFLQRWQHVAPSVAAARRRRNAADHPPARRLRDSGRRLGGADSSRARRRLQARVSRPALLLRRRDVGTPLAASGARAARRRDVRGACGRRSSRRSRCSRARTPKS